MEYGLPTITSASKSELAATAKADAQRIIDNGQTLVARVAIAAISEYLKNLKAAIEDASYEVAEEKAEEKSTFDYMGVKLQLKEGAVRYDFSDIKEIANLEAKIEQLKEFAKNASEDMPVVMPTTHEVIKSVKKTYGKNTLTVILNK